MDTLTKAFLFLTVFLMALIGGLFYSYSCSVNPGLGQLSDSEYLKAMKSINRAILNPWFFLSFIGTLLVTPLTAIIYFRNVGVDLGFYLLLASFIIYFLGVFGVTVLGNVPLNNSLDAFEMRNATFQELSLKRLSFELPWNRLHFVRTVANILSLLFAIGAIVAKLS
jgi:uncharacterized membrane protein